MSSQFFVLFMTLYIVALLKRQGVNVKGLLKADAVKEEPQPYIDCTGHLQVLC
jgi:gelsolin